MSRDFEIKHLQTSLKILRDDYVLLEKQFLLGRDHQYKMRCEQLATDKENNLLKAEINKLTKLISEVANDNAV